LVLTKPLPERRVPEQQTVAIVVNTYNQAHFLHDSLQSCIQQSARPSEILVVDDGSDDKPEEIAASFPGVAIHRQENAGLSTARNAGLARVSSEFVVFLDADDRLTPAAIEAGLECFACDPDAWLVYGAYRVIDASGRAASPILQEQLGTQPFLDLLRGDNIIAMHGAVMYRTDRLRSIGGFDEKLRLCEDYDLYLRIARRGRIASHDCCVAEYRHYEGNASRDKSMMLAVAGSVVRTRAAEDQSREADVAARLGQKQLIRHYAPEIFVAGGKSIVREGWSWETAKMMLKAAQMAPLASLITVMSRGMKAVVRCFPRSIGRHFGEVLWVPEIGSVQFGDLGRSRPISREFGYDRGKPIDRYYIERALQDCAALIRGRILEVGGRDYTRLFGGDKVESSDVLDIDKANPVATIVADLSVVGTLPEAAFDCIVLTQTLQLIYAVRDAVENLFRALAPGGTLLVTVPGISPIGRHELGNWYWTFTERSMEMLLGDRFGEENVQVQSYGNVFAAICFLTGLSVTEVETKKLEYRDASYPVTVFACARKPR
jgi:glycosyltransferase involved in cell wall biosynthesis